MSEILLNETVEIKLKDRKYNIGKLTLKQVLQLSKFLTKALIANKNKMVQLKERSVGSSTNADDIMTILDILEENDVVRFFSIILKENDHSWLEENLGLEETIEIITALCECNNFESIKKNFQKLIGLLNQPKQDQA
jgi:hypothetical protein